MTTLDKKTSLSQLHIQQMFSASIASLFVGVFLAAIFAYMQSKVIPSDVVLVWFSFFVLISLFRLAQYIAYLRAPDSDNSLLQSRLIKFRVGVLTSGIIWGMTSIFLFPADNIQYQMFLIFILAGLTAGGVVSFSADPVSSFGYALTVLLPLIIRSFVSDDEMSNAMGMAGLMYLGFIIFTSRYIHLNISQNYVLHGKALEREEKLHFRTNELELHISTLSRMSQGFDLAEMLDQMLQKIEQLHPEMICSIMLYDNNSRSFSFGAAPRLLNFFNQAFNGLTIGDEQNKNGTAPFHKKRVIVDDVQQHPYWAAFRDLARLAAIHSCWSQPFRNGQGKILGSFIIYHRQQTHATETQLTLLERYANLARTVIENYNSENELRIAATAFETQESLMITDANRRIIRVNQAFIDETGYTAEEVLNKSPRILSSGRHDDAFYKAIWDNIAQTGSWQGEVWDRRKNGEVYPKWLTITAVKSADKKVTHYVGSHVDITDRKASEEQILNLAFFDPLTGLPNRRLLMDRLQQALATVTRSDRSGALLFIDLDNFKTLNDSLGHDIGDLLLKEVGARLLTCLRVGDTVARLGGDEFVVILEDLNDLGIEAAEQARVIGNKIFDALTQTYQLLNHEYHCTPSIGVTLYGNQKVTIDELLKQADIAMYQAKQAGRNTIRFFDAHMQKSINLRAVLESELHSALSNQEFHLYYQLQVNDKLQPLGAETLIRWIHPERGLVSPVEFIPLAEELGLILPIGRWVLETACAQLKRWESDPSTCNLVLAVNVSAKQFNQIDFVEQVLETVKLYDINPSRLKLELTESMLIENIEDIISCMNILKKIGIQFSLDDFGTGYSSLQYLQKIPLDQLKIDQSFVKNLSDKHNNNAIVKTIIAMAHGLKLDIIAEGVETDAQKKILLSLGCHHFQGFLFSKPVPLAEFESLLQINEWQV